MARPNMGRYQRLIKGDLKVYYALLFSGLNKKDLDSMTADELYEAWAAYSVLNKKKKGGR